MEKQTVVIIGAGPAGLTAAYELLQRAGARYEITVLEEADPTVVRLRGDSFFASGSAEPTTQSLPVLRRIGEALAEVKGDVLVLGHSDNQPIRSARYPSNWHLSTARAEGVKAALAQVVDPARMRARGKADAEPDQQPS